MLRMVWHGLDASAFELRIGQKGLDQRAAG
jgi:hypothetical protein